jgi:zinc protease
MSRVVALALLLALVGPPVEGRAAPPADAPLPTDPRLVEGQLANGLSYVIRRHPTAERRVGVWLQVATGSLNETDATRGIAHYLEHLAFTGSANFPPGALIPLFESFGLTFGRDKNAFTSFDQTTYQISVPAGQAEMLDRALLFMADVASRLELLPEEIDRERQVILEEKRARESPARRVQDQVLTALAPELGRRLPIGTEATIRSVALPDFREFYRRWYVPSNMTLIVAGDCDPAEVAALIERHFGDAPPAPRPAPRPVAIPATAGTRAIIATDPELTRADVSLVRLEPARAAATTVGEYRRDLVESIGAWLLSRRLEADVARGGARFEEAGATIGRWARVARTVTARASGRPEAWRDMLADLGEALQRARLHGFTEQEVADARRALLAQARDAVARDATTPIRSVLGRLNAAVADRAPVMSAAQRLALLEDLLPGIAVGEVSRAFRDVFDPTNVAVVATLPSSADAPDEPALARIGRAALDVTPAADPARERPAALLAAPPPGGSVVEETIDPASAVTSVWLDNGVRAHHRFMDQRRGEVIVVVTLAGGVIEEGAGTRGFTSAAIQAWNQPATSRLASTDIRDLLVGARVGLSAGVGEDTVALTVQATPGDLETAFQLLHLMLTDPVIEPVALGRWREAAREGIARRELEPLRALQDVAADALVPPAEVRMRPLGRADVDAVTRDAAQAWLRRLVTAAPIELAVVGDVDREAALRLVAQYVGALPARDRIGEATLAGLRQVAPPPGPIRVARSLTTRTPQAAVLAGFRTVDGRDRREARLLTVAARILTSRMYRELREQQQLVYGIGAVSRPAFAYPGFGVFVAQAPTDPARADALAAAVEGMYAHFAVEGPTEAEVNVAGRQLVSLVDQQLERPEFWADWLATNAYRGRRPDEPFEARAVYAQVSPGDVHATFRRYWRAEGRFTILVTPAEVDAPAVPPPPAAPSAPAAPAAPGVPAPAGAGPRPPSP